MKTYLSSNPKVMGGQLVIVGTRIPIKRILFLIKQAYSLEDIQLQYPHVSLKTFEAVVDEISRSLERYRYGSQAPSL